MITNRNEDGTIKAHEPTDKSRAEVAALSSFGHTQEEISIFVDISEDTLVKYYRRELDTAVIRANAQVAKSLFNKAVKQDDLSAQIFWLKTRGRWRTADQDDARQRESAVEKLLLGKKLVE